MLLVSRLIVEEGETQRSSDLSTWPARTRGCPSSVTPGLSLAPALPQNCRAGKGSQVRRTSAGNYWWSGPDFPLADLTGRKMGRNWSAAASPQGPEKMALGWGLRFGLSVPPGKFEACLELRGARCCSPMSHTNLPDQVLTSASHTPAVGRGPRLTPPWSELNSRVL